jgi:hypothetical protein
MAAERSAGAGNAQPSTLNPETEVGSRPKPSGAGLAMMNPSTGDPSETLDCLLDELQLCIRYHQGVFPSRPIEKLVFLGGESLHVSTCQRIARTLRIGAQLGDPLARLMRMNPDKGSAGLDLRRPQPGWAVPLGLCLSDVEEKP